MTDFYMRLNQSCSYIIEELCSFDTLTLSTKKKAAHTKMLSVFNTTFFLISVGVVITEQEVSSRYVTMACVLDSSSVI